MLPTYETEWISEEALAKQLNVPREKIRAERPLLAPSELTKKGNVISWARNAAQRVAGKLGIPQASPEKNAPAVTAVTVAPAPSAAIEGELLTVYSQPMRPGGPHFANEFLIKAKREGGEQVVVRVLNSAKFLPRLRTGEPMTFRAKKAEGNWWRLIGREPRQPGQW